MLRTIAVAGCLAIFAGAAALPAQDARTRTAGTRTSRIVLKIKLTSVMVDNQEKALKFYTGVLGFVKKRDMPAGKDRWLTVVSPEAPADVELLLEPIGFPPARTFQKALFDAGIPATSFAVNDVQKTYEGMVKLGVVFRVKPTKEGPTTVAVFDDTCGNLIQIFQEQ
jgi:catechol 2,3-dioxygenase-like lactoylglutathione lyase family enzyme